MSTEGGSEVERKVINPWTWQDQFGYVQANAISDGNRVVYCAGQASVDDDGNPTREDDMAGQLNNAFDNLETVLQQAGATLSEVVRLSYYVTDIEAFFRAMETIGPRLAQAKCRPASTLLRVAGLALPELLVEIEATAVLGTSAS
jgi:enamine deaminase RidA (YjgF/YER057c/UK114 family)